MEVPTPTTQRRYQQHLHEWLQKHPADWQRGKVGLDRKMLAAKPQWSMAGDIRTVQRGIERSLMVKRERETRDYKPFVYILNPPRHGKSLVLDLLFEDDPSVCVIPITYNADNGIVDRELRTAKDALDCFFLRVVDSLGIQMRSFGAILKGNPFTQCKDVYESTTCFQEMLGISSTAGDRSLGKLLICIDEISELVDHSFNEWSNDQSELTKFWKNLFSLQVAVDPWLRIVMTGFTENPRQQVEDSGVRCEVLSLQMITAAEQEALAAELLWAYASNNKPFPGFLWQVVKSTPGLLGTWAYLLGLQSPLSQCVCDRYATLQHFAAKVPWAGSLKSNAEVNWAVIRDFLFEPSTTNKAAARNAKLATELQNQVVLSPFAVAVTVDALRGSILVKDDVLFHHLNNVVAACEAHSAGCVSDHSIDWRTRVHKHLWNYATGSLLLSAELQAVFFPQGAAHYPGATVTNQGKPFEDFVKHALGLKLHILVASRTGGAVRASDILPPRYGLLDRSDERIGVCVVCQPTLELPKLLTQTAALMLPSSVDMMLKPASAEMISSRFLQRATFEEHGVEINDTYACGGGVYVITEQDRQPCHFPMFLLDPNKDMSLHFRVVEALKASVDNGEEQAAFLARMLALPEFCCQKSAETQLCRMYTDVDTMFKMCRCAVASQKAFVFAPTGQTNPGCDNIILLPHATHKLTMVFVEVRDRLLANFGAKLSKWCERPLLLSALSALLVKHGIECEFLLLLAGRTEQSWQKPAKVIPIAPPSIDF